MPSTCHASETGYEVHINFSPIILTSTCFEDWTDLLLQLDTALSPAAKAQLALEVIFLTYNELLHETNLGWHPNAETLLWHPDLQVEAEGPAQRGLPRGGQADAAKRFRALGAVLPGPVRILIQRPERRFSSARSVVD